MANAKQHEIFNTKVHKLLIGLGAIQPGKHGYKYLLETKAGVLYLTTDEPRKSEIFSVYCRFESPENAKNILSKWEHDRLNIYSGKWNYHQRDAAYLIDRLESSLKDLVLVPIDNH